MKVVCRLFATWHIQHLGQFFDSVQEPFLQAQYMNYLTMIWVNQLIYSLIFDLWRRGDELNALLNLCKSCKKYELFRSKFNIASCSCILSVIQIFRCPDAHPLVKVFFTEALNTHWISHYQPWFPDRCFWLWNYQYYPTILNTLHHSALEDSLNLPRTM